ncbi:hypothetical protein [Methylobacterium sp. J-076]|uniref:hypothetical protein n=1 Tax=Methylobacterium sp. J-076 TaxID=2836655 RepID=UPI001FB9C52D|nr:hypothetical protein [Methylobacterium sp. J-076]MCJ2012328.1 hypothetical protein [Methylobacterium sp. J-076]
MHDAIACRWIVPTLRAGPQYALLAWITTWGAIIGTVWNALAHSKEMLLINRLLFGADTVLMLAWMVVIVLEKSDEEP